MSNPTEISSPAPLPRTSPRGPREERRITAVVGNPRRGSRTHALAGTVTDLLALALGAAEVETVDLAALGALLLEPGDESAAAARALVASSDLVVVATPVYKATYTGLLKLFFDGYGPNALAGVTAVEVVVSAAPAHLLATDIHLRALLVELGAAVPTRSLGVVESQLAESDAVVGEWVRLNAGVLRRSVGADRDREQVPA